MEHEDMGLGVAGTISIHKVRFTCVQIQETIATIP